ncbi:hypothetical protein BJ875DRAFT_274869 [Amylocarpus encephaloides]|uniref:F-box domain-containing protein n=1 Tax=Amylocarpus encephaloides TaxID=45428 RepID=A0A9P8C9Y5_9HELO|nr:hypothetical protein BJ875DRAFT_274869 [Amylocarpus encephaloides]
MAVSSATIESLPNEILLSILSLFSTRILLSLAPVSRHFHNVILRVLRCRLIEAASDKDHKLILECYHPSAQFFTPYVFCDYISTPGLSHSAVTDWGADAKVGALGELSNLYSYFRPLNPGRAEPQHPAGSRWLALSPMGLVEKHEELVCQEIHLDSNELFSQLITTTNLVKLGPKPGVFMSAVTICEGLTRVWRNWLSERASCPRNPCEQLVKERDQKFLWSDSSRQVGMRMNVEKRKDVPEPVIQLRDEDPPVSYILQYEELAIKTSQLLLMMEHARDEEISHSGKAIIIGSWRLAWPLPRRPLPASYQ